MSYLNETGLGYLWSKITGKFSALGHKHTTADLTNYTVDTALSSTSTNPVQNKAIKTEFDSLQGDVDYANQTLTFVTQKLENHVHTISRITNLRTELDNINAALESKIEQFSLVSDGNGNVTIAGSSEAASAAEGVEF